MFLTLKKSYQVSGLSHLFGQCVEPIFQGQNISKKMRAHTPYIKTHTHETSYSSSMYGRWKDGRYVPILLETQKQARCCCCCCCVQGQNCSPSPAMTQHAAPRKSATVLAILSPSLILEVVAAALALCSRISCKATRRSLRYSLAFSRALTSVYPSALRRFIALDS